VKDGRGKPVGSARDSPRTQCVHRVTARKEKRGLTKQTGAGEGSTDRRVPQRGFRGRETEIAKPGTFGVAFLKIDLSLVLLLLHNSLA
jgi:hypothetical protein